MTANGFGAFNFSHWQESLFCKGPPGADERTITITYLAVDGTPLFALTLPNSGPFKITSDKAQTTTVDLYVSGAIQFAAF